MPESEKSGTRGLFLKGRRASAPHGAVAKRAGSEALAAHFGTLPEIRPSQGKKAAAEEEREMNNPDHYTKGARVKPAPKAIAQAIGGTVGTVLSRWPIDQIVTVKWDGKNSDERWHVDLLDLA